MRGGTASRRAAWGLADQAFSSLTNFALSAIVARSVSPTEFGRFALVFATYLLALGLARAMTTLPLLVRFSAVSEGEWRLGARRATGTAVTLGLVGGFACLVGSLVFADLRAPLLALAVSLPGLLLQEAWRLAFVSRGTPRLALVNDVVWAMSLIPFMLFVILSGVDSAAPFILAWGASATIGAVVGMAQVRLVPTLRGPAWIRRHWDLSGPQVGEFATLSGSQQGVMYAAGAIGGLVAAGALRAGQVLLGPLHVAYQGTWFIALSEFVRLRRTRPGRFVPASMGVSLILGLGGLMYAALLVALGPTIGPVLLGESWPKASEVVVPLAVAAAGIGFGLGANVGLRALEEAMRSLSVRLVIGVLSLIGGISGVVLAGAEGGAWGLAAASLTGVFFYWWNFMRAWADRSGQVDLENGSVVAVETPPVQ
jgi:O-antigen/teichoic acid export membrane protein